MKSKLILVKFELDVCYAELVGLVVCTNHQLKDLIGKHVYFGEKAGKHSSVDAKMEHDMFEIVTDDELYIAQTLKMFNVEHDGDPVGVFGINPFDYYDEENEDDDE